MDGHLQKAQIYNEDTHDLALECMFNPPDYTVSRKNTWDTAPLMSQNVSAPNFKGGGQTSMKFQLFFDTYTASTDTYQKATAEPEDVRDYTKILMTLMDIGDKKRPPLVSFHWGNHWSFKGVIDSVSLKFTLFTAAGTPVRATADVELHQAEEESASHKSDKPPHKKHKGHQKRQNPTSGGDGPQVRYVVQLGDTLDLITYQQYGDPTKWRTLADANGIEDPRALRPGQRLVIPSQ